ncbi:hypothetical protein ACIQCR_34780 [Streptomyces sp. NPDC093249]|uniref:hypothetical protein n=1 Tax=unclassified Streptomyces TaxID=2593676 RepID=UPI00381971A4
MSGQAEELRRVRVVSLLGVPVVEIDGADVTSLLSGYHVRHEAGQPPEVVLEVSP